MPARSQQKENDPALGKLRRLSSITSITAITTPLGNIATKFRRPSTAVPPLKSSDADTSSKKSLLPRSNRQISNALNKAQAHVDVPWLVGPSSRTPAQGESRLPKSQTTSNLSMLLRREPSHLPLPSSRSSTNLGRSRHTTPTGMESIETLETPNRARDFMNLRKTNGSALPRFSTQPNLLSSGLHAPVRPKFTETLTGGQEVVEDKRKIFASEAGPVKIPTVAAPLMKVDIPKEKERDGRDQHATFERPVWQFRTPSKPAMALRKSIEDEYEEMQSPPKRSLGKEGELNISPRRSLGGDIQHHQLMAPLSPPLPRLPAGHMDNQEASSLSSARLIRQVTQAQPPAYWSGRYTSLNDRLMNEATDVSPSCSKFSFSAFSNEEHNLSWLASSAHGEAHAQHILNLLYAACMTEEAMRSLRIWQISFGHAGKMPGLVSYTPTTAFATLVTGTQGKAREPPVLHSTSGNGNYFSTGEARNVDPRGRKLSDVLGARSDGSPMTALRDMSMESLPEGGSLRKTSFIDRLLGGNRKVSGKTNGLGGKGAGTMGYDNDRVGLSNR